VVSSFHPIFNAEVGTGRDVAMYMFADVAQMYLRNNGFLYFLA
jgi:hypothetical protein